MRKRLDEMLGPRGGFGEQGQVCDFLQAVGISAAPHVDAYLQTIENANDREKVLRLIAECWPAYALEHYFTNACESGDMGRLYTIIKDLRRIGTEQQPKALDAIALCAAKFPSLHQSLIYVLTEWPDKPAAITQLKRIRNQSVSAETRFAAAQGIHKLRTGADPKTPEMPMSVCEVSSSEDVSLARQLYVLALEGRKQREVPKGAPVPGANTTRVGPFEIAGMPAKFEFWPWAHSAEVYLCVLGHTALPLIKERFLDPGLLTDERDLLQWVLDLNKLAVPDVSEKFVAAFFAAKPENRRLALEAYRSANNQRRNRVEAPDFGDANPENMTSAQRLKAFAEADSHLQGQAPLPFEVLASMDPKQRPTVDARSWDGSLKLACWLIRKFQQDNDAVGELARELWALSE